MPDSWPDLARALVAELIGTMLLVLIGCGAAVNWKTSFDVTQVISCYVLGCFLRSSSDLQKLNCFPYYTIIITSNIRSDLFSLSHEFHQSFKPLNHLLAQVSLAFGLAVMAIASFTGHVSGG